MINPIVIIVTVALFMSVLAVSIINKPKKPIVTAVMIIILMAYVSATFLLDSWIANLNTESSFDGLVHFIVMNDNPNYDDIESSFRTFMIFDILLIAASLLSLFTEIMIILRKDSKR